MTKITTISLTTALALAISFGSTAYAQNIETGYNKISVEKAYIEISKKNARNLVKALLKRDYNGFGYKAQKIKKSDDKWVVTIKDRKDFVATAYVNDNNGNIHVSYKRHKPKK